MISIRNLTLVAENGEERKEILKRFIEFYKQDKYSELAREYGVMSIPTLILFKNNIFYIIFISFIRINFMKSWIFI